METVGERVARMAADRGWSQTELAKRAGLDPKGGPVWLSRLMAGKRKRVDPVRLSRVAAALGVTTEELFGKPAMRPSSSNLVDLAAEVERRKPELVERAKGILQGLLLLSVLGAAIPGSVHAMRRPQSSCGGDITLRRRRRWARRNVENGKNGERMAS